MNKEQQKDEIILAVKEAFNDNAEPTPFVREYIELDGNDIDHIAEQTAENLYNAGWRKTFTSDLASDTQKAFKEGYQKGFDDRDEEFKIIMERNEQLLKRNAQLEEKLNEFKKQIDKFIKDREKQAVKEFADKLQKELPCRDYTFNGNTYSMVLTSSMKYVIDKLLKEYEK